MRSWRTFYMAGRKQRFTWVIGLAIVTLVLAFASLFLGAASLSMTDVFSVLFGKGGEMQTQIVLYARLPRLCGCLMAGSALAVAGVIIQRVLNNPLASPNIIGVNSGAGLGTVLCCALAPEAFYLTPAAAFFGALAGVLIVLFIADRAGASRMTIVLSGVAMSGIFSAGIDAVVTFFPDALNGYTDFRIGGVKNLSLARLTPAFWMICIAFVLVFFLAKELDLLLLGQEMAQSLGLPAKLVRFILLVLAAALAGAAVSFAGLLSFVGLLVPHIMRRLLGEDSMTLLIASALGGASLLTFGDLLSRILFAPFELPLGIVLSLAGGPFFIWLLLKQRRGGAAV